MITLDKYFAELSRYRGDELSAEDEELIGTAFELGAKYHEGQKRANGDEYFEGHCIPVSYNVAQILISQKNNCLHCAEKTFAQW